MTIWGCWPGEEEGNEDADEAAAAAAAVDAAAEFAAAAAAAPEDDVASITSMADMLLWSHRAADTARKDAERGGIRMRFAKVRLLLLPRLSLPPLLSLVVVGRCFPRCVLR